MVHSHLAVFIIRDYHTDSFLEKPARKRAGSPRSVAKVNHLQRWGAKRESPSGTVRYQGKRSPIFSDRAFYLGDERMKRHRGFTLIEVMLAVAIIALGTAISIPVISRMKLSANEGAAQGSLVAYRTSMENYRFINGRFPALLSALAPTGARLSYGDPKLAQGSRQGYNFILSSDASRLTYAITAAPTEPTRTGNRFFILDHSGTITESRLSRGTTSTAGTPAQRTGDRVTRMAAALERFKAQNGRYPRSLNELNSSHWDGDMTELSRMQQARSSNTAHDKYAYFYGNSRSNRYYLLAYPQYERQPNGTYRPPEGANQLYYASNGRVTSYQLRTR